MGSRRRKRSRDAPEGRPEPIYPTLDLHGETAESARRITERWMREKSACGDTVVRVVTGRGLHSVGRPVLRGEIEGLLRSLKGGLVRDYVADYGGGSFRVELRLPQRASIPPRAAGRPDDPELRRRAEESLEELGITPTPELIRAEMERLGRET